MQTKNPGHVASYCLSLSLLIPDHTIVMPEFTDYVLVHHCYYLNTALPGTKSGDALLTRSFNHRVLRPGETATSVMENSHRCLCGKLYGQQSALSYHQRMCKSAKTRLSSALGQAKEFLQSAKKRRLVAAEFLAPQGSLSDLSDPVPSFPATSSQVIINQSTATP